MYKRFSGRHNLFSIGALLFIVGYFWIASEVFNLNGDEILEYFLLGLISLLVLAAGGRYAFGWFQESNQTKPPSNIKKMLLDIGRSKVQFPILMCGGQYGKEIHFYESLDSMIELGGGTCGSDYIIDSDLQKFDLLISGKDRDDAMEYETPTQGGNMTLDGVKKLFTESMSGQFDELVKKGYQTGRYYAGVVDEIQSASSIESIIYELKEVHG